MSRKTKDRQSGAVKEQEDEDVEPGVLIAFVRLLKRWPQKKLARRAYVDPSQISRYESGETIPEPESLERVLAAGGLRAHLVAPVKAFLRLLRQALERGEAAVPTPRDEPGQSERLRQAVWGVAERALSLVQVELGVLRAIPKEETPVPPTAADQARVEDLLGRLRRCPQRRRQFLVQESAAFHDWVLCVRLCDESLAAAACDPQSAIAWAGLARAIAARAPGPLTWRNRLGGFAEAHLGNACRVANRLSAADQAFARSRRLWQEGKDDSCLFDPARPIDLEAALRRHQGHFEEAIRLHDLALQLARPDQVGVLLLSKASTLEIKGDYESSIEHLRAAATEVDKETQPRLSWVLRFNLAGNLIRLNRAEEALPIVAEVRTLADQLQNDLDLLRTRWLEGNALAGVKQQDEAIEALEEVCRAFEERKLPYDYALACLDLALVYRAVGRLADVQRLAAEMVEIFQAFKVQREAIAAAVIFRDAAVQGAVTETLVRRLQEYFPKVRANPKLRFEP
ncbi:MAG TPA: helix-turn-helix transcriptional regulator [Thermoanaerobaculia bacterium]|nr:helix-turn-helix transcriptional regulator [Thermoanaerobaculia bacterium]